MHYLLTITLGLLALLPLHGQQANEPYLEAELTDKNLIPGEQTNLIVSLHGARLDSRPAPPEVPNTAINYVRTIPRLNNRGELTQLFLYRLTPAQPGQYTVPPFKIISAGKLLQSPSIRFKVHDPSQFTSLSTGFPNQDILAAWFPAKNTLYQGEQCPIILKLYAPEKLRIVNWGLPDPVKENCLAWRFSTPDSSQLGRVSINGTPHLSVKYQTTLSGINAGTAIFGPTKTRLIVRQRMIDPRVGARISDTPVELNLPALNFTILPFPQDAPADFQGAVGQFQIRAHCSKLTLNDTDTTEVILQVGGTGNLETIKPPTLTGNNWKVIDTSKITRGEERRFISGVVTFRQLIRPALNSQKETPDSIPPYSFSYFDPDKKTYHTLTTPAIPVNVIATADSSRNAADTPHPDNHGTTGTSPDEMTGILGFIDKPQLPTSGSPLQISRLQISRYWHIIPAALCLCIIGIPLLRKIKSVNAKHPDDLKKKSSLKKLSEPSDTRTFYRRAGRFIDQWLKPNEELNNILAERDRVCFLPETTHVDDIPNQRKQEIIQLLKRCSKLTLSLLTPALFFLVLAPPTSHANTPLEARPETNTARDAWKEGRYQQAIETYQKAYPNPTETPADILYNIGNCHYRLKQFGDAALAWRRALMVNPTHQNARQNLRYLEIEQASFTPDLEPWQLYLTHISPQTYRSVFYASLWIFLIILLWLIFAKPKRKALLITILFFMPAIATLGGLGIYFFPDSDFHIPFNQQAVSLREVALYKEAHRQEKDPPKLPPASYIQVLAKRGSWIHVKTTDDQTGWVQDEDIGVIEPSPTKTNTTTSIPKSTSRESTRNQPPVDPPGQSRETADGTHTSSSFARQLEPALSYGS